MTLKEKFYQIKKIIRQDENYVPRKYKTVGGEWTVDTWKKDDVVYQIMDEGYTDRIFVKDALDVSRTYDHPFVFCNGDEDVLRETLERLVEE